VQVCAAMQPFNLSFAKFTPAALDVFNNRPWPAPNRPPQKSTFSDSSGPLFSMYSEIAEEEDDQMAKRWQKDADALLIFVSRSLQIYAVAHINWNTLDGFILRCCRSTAFSVSSGHEAKLTRYIGLLSRIYLSAPCC
jgi:hypothetical protein